MYSYLCDTTLDFAGLRRGLARKMKSGNRGRPEESLHLSCCGMIGFCAGTQFYRANCPIGAHRCRNRCLSWLGYCRPGRVRRFFLLPGADSIDNCALRVIGRVVFRLGKSELRGPRGPRQPLGAHGICFDRTAGRLSAGLDGPE